MKSFKQFIAESKKKKKLKKMDNDPCWDGYVQRGMKKKNGKMVPNCIPESTGTFYEDSYGSVEYLDLTEEDKKNVKLNNPFRTPGGPKKFSVYVKNDKGNVVKVNFGDPNMEIKRDSDERRKAFRARHNCDNPGPKWKPRYWSCYQWRKGAKVDN